MGKEDISFIKFNMENLISSRHSADAAKTNGNQQGNKTKGTQSSGSVRQNNGRENSNLQAWQNTAYNNSVFGNKYNNVYINDSALLKSDDDFATTWTAAEEGGSGDQITYMVGENGGSDEPTFTTLATNEEGGSGIELPTKVTPYIPDDITPEDISKLIGEDGEAPSVTTYAVNEEGGGEEPTFTTLATNEEGGSGIELPTKVTPYIPDDITPEDISKLIGEDGEAPSVTTYAVNEEGGGTATTMAIGEEGGSSEIE